jgi:hypothetical protein
MCIVISQGARLSNTTIYAAEVLHPTQGDVHVIGYQNTVEASPHAGPNAMILPLPTDQDLGPANVIDGRGALKTSLGVYAKAVEAMKPRMRSLSFGRGDLTKGARLESPSFQVFDSGSYTIALGSTAEALPEALKQVSEDKRPRAPASFFVELAKAYPATPMAICCFKGSFQAEPLFWWYKPRDPSRLVAPGIDAHDGNPPVPGKVSRDHTLIWGSYRAEGLRDGAGVQRDLPPHWALTSGIVGSMVQERQSLNGDFYFPVADLFNPQVPGYIGGDQAKIQLPPGWS